jgi:hypothetical protein
MSSDRNVIATKLDGTCAEMDFVYKLQVRAKCSHI